MKTKLLCLVAPALGILAMLLAGSGPPLWLLRLEVMIFAAAALAFGFSAFTPAAPAWVFSQPLRGVVCIYLGIGAMFVPSQFIVSAVFLGIGTRLMLGHTERAAATAKPPSPTLSRQCGDLAVREAGPIVPRS